MSIYFDFGCRKRSAPALTISSIRVRKEEKISFIEKANKEYLEVLLHQNKVRLYNAEFEKVEDYGTINGLWRTLKGNQKFGEQVVQLLKLS